MFFLVSVSDCSECNSSAGRTQVIVVQMVYCMICIECRLRCYCRLVYNSVCPFFSFLVTTKLKENVYLGKFCKKMSIVSMLGSITVWTAVLPFFLNVAGGCPLWPIQKGRHLPSVFTNNIHSVSTNRGTGDFDSFDIFFINSKTRNEKKKLIFTFRQFISSGFLGTKVITADQANELIKVVKCAKEWFERDWELCQNNENLQ